jgi:hypothetical protein
MAAVRRPGEWGSVMIWVVSACLAIPVALLHLAGVPLIWAVVIATCVLLAVVVAAGRKASGPVAVASTAAVVLVLAGIVALVHGGSPASHGPAVVTFSDGAYSSYGAPSFSVDATNTGGSAEVIHTVRVRFVNQQTAQVIADVTEQVGATVLPGQGQTLTYSAPQAVTNTGIADRWVDVTVTGWS